MRFAVWIFRAYLQRRMAKSSAVFSGVCNFVTDAVNFLTTVISTREQLLIDPVQVFRFVVVNLSTTVATPSFCDSALRHVSQV